MATFTTDPMSITLNFTPAAWEGACISVLNHSNGGWIDGVVDKYGHLVHNLSSESSAAWGVNISTCQSICSASAIPMDFSFADFSASMTNYLLPWLALTAQLPFEAGDPWSNMLVFCMAVGSPVLVTYSLTITILNRFWVRSVFKDLLRRAQSRGVKNKFDFGSRVKAVQFLLQETQQVPLRCSQEKGWLSSLLGKISRKLYS
jgi:hypothetical protein